MKYLLTFIILFSSLCAENEYNQPEEMITTIYTDEGTQSQYMIRLEGNENEAVYAIDTEDGPVEVLIIYEDE